MSRSGTGPGPAPGARAVAALFGTLFALALLAVPVTTWTVQDRRDPGSNVIVRTTHPQRRTMFLPACLAASGRAATDGGAAIRTAPWLSRMAVILALGIFDYAFVRRRFRRKNPPPGGASEARL